MEKIQELDKVGAFCSYDCHESTSSKGPLNGLSFGLKDIFDVKGYPTGFGSPGWLKSHPIATNTTSAVQSLLDAGATLVGKTHCDELTYNLFGNNLHYGTPINSNALGRMPGGSSNGSAAALAANLVDFSIGSDTGGSVRAPASFCGLFGIRPSHGVIPLDHACSLAPSFDTLGWFTHSPQLLKTIGEVLLQKSAPHDVLKNSQIQLSYLKEAFNVIDPHNAQILKNTFEQLNIQNSISEVSIGNNLLSEWADTFRIIQGSEIWKNLGPWVEEHWEDISPPTKARLEIAKGLDPLDIETALLKWPMIQSTMNHLLQKSILILPTVAGIAPLLDAPLSELEVYRKQCFQLLCIAGLCGLPQINLPITNSEGAPVGISILGAKGSDLQLLQIACELFN